MRARSVHEAKNVEELPNDELKDLYQKDPESEDGIISKTELNRRKSVNGEDLDESIDFKRNQNPHQALGVGIFDRADEFISFLQEEMKWNNPQIELIEDDGYNEETPYFHYVGLAGSSLIPELTEAIEKFGWRDVMKVEGDEENTYNERGGDEYHTYYILKK